MAYPEINIIVAYDKDHGIGYRGKMPWNLPADLRHFQRVTLGHPIIMGRRTWESLPGILPNRQNIVISSTLGAIKSPYVNVVDSLESALVVANTERVFVIGGGQLYLEAVNHSCTRRVIATEIDAEFQADAWFPHLDAEKWYVSGNVPQIPQNDLNWRIVTYKRG